MAAAPANLRKSLHYMFVDFNQDVLKARLPWYIPEWLGGYGMTGVKEPSEKDLRMAQKILFEWQTQKPYPTGSNPSRWKIWDLARARMPPPNLTDDPNDPGIKEYESHVHAEAMNLLLDSNIKIDDLLTGGNTRFIKKKIALNEKLWKLPTGPLPQPIDKKKIEYHKLFETERHPWSSSVLATKDMTEAELTIRQASRDLDYNEKIVKTPNDVVKLAPIEEEENDEWPKPELLYPGSFLEESKPLPKGTIGKPTKAIRSKPKAVQMHEARKNISKEERRRDQEKFWHNWDWKI